MLQADNGQILYAACIIKHTPRGPVPDTEYYHADDIVTARNIIRRVYPNRRLVTIIEVAPAVGVFATDAEDKYGKVYTAS